MAKRADAAAVDAATAAEEAEAEAAVARVVAGAAAAVVETAVARAAAAVPAVLQLGERARRMEAAERVEVEMAAEVVVGTAEASWAAVATAEEGLVGVATASVATMATAEAPKAVVSAACIGTFRSSCSGSSSCRRAGGRGAAALLQTSDNRNCSLPERLEVGCGTARSSVSVR